LAVSKRRSILAALPDPRARFLESFPKLNVPEPAFEGGKRFFVVGLESSGHKRRIGIKYVLRSEGNRRVVQPSAHAPSPVVRSDSAQFAFYLGDSLSPISQILAD
jgi:hypothetical protein